MNPVDEAVILSAMTRAAVVEYFELLTKKIVNELQLNPISYWNLRSASTDLRDAASYWNISEKLKGGDRAAAKQIARDLDTLARDRITSNIWKYLNDQSD